MKWSIWRFLLVWLFYGILSILALTFSSTGWTALIILMGTTIFYGGVLVISTVISLIFASQGIKEVLVSKKVLRSIVFLQVLTILFNYGDCGDNPGGSIFLLRIFSSNDCLISSSGSNPLIWVFLGLISLLAFSYLISLGVMYWKSGRQKSSTTLSLIIIYLLTIVIIFITLANMFHWFSP